MLTAQDICGVSVMAPTPCVEGGDHWSKINSVDLEETARMTENFIRDGVGSIALNGTTGEGATLLWEEKVAFLDTVVQVNQRRVPIFAGATCLGIKETIQQMRALKDLGADGAFVGLPLWQTPTLENSIRWFADLSEAVPDMPIMVYSNSRVFKSVFPREFWEGVAKRAPTVVTNKIASPAIMEDLEEIVRRTGNRIRFLPIDHNVYAAWKRVGDHIRACWSTTAAMGPEPSVALMDAIQQGDDRRAAAIDLDIRSVRSSIPEGQWELFAYYNVQEEKARFRAAGYIKCGPSRAPYLYEDLPEEWRRAAEANGKAWTELRKKYAPAPIP